MTTSGGLDYTDAVLPWLVMAAVLLALLPWLDRHNRYVRPVMLGFCIVISWRYMSWRLLETIPPPDKPLDFIFGLIFFVVEFLAAICATICYVFLSRATNRSAEADANVAWMAEHGIQPKVDVLICTYNESEIILERTIVAAMSMSYGNYRLWVCDDGRRDWLRDRCAKDGIGYLTRADNAHAKAGNINAAVAHLATLEEKPEFLLVIDADFVVNPMLLTRALSLMREPDVGVVQTPQHFFNPDPVQSNLNIASVWPDEQRFFFDEVMPSRDAWGVAFCCGTSAVIRFDALMSIGGFPTTSVTEDYLVSVRLVQAGYRTVYLNEVLSLGLAPEGLAEYTLQRSRWSLGFAQMFRSKDGPFALQNNLPIMFRISLIEGLLYWGATHSFRIMGMIAPTLYLLFDIQVVHANAVAAVDHLVPYFLLTSIVFAWLTGGRVMPIMAELYQALSAIEIVKSIYVGLTKPLGHKFRVTAKGGVRTRKYIQWPMLRVFATSLFIVSLGIVAAFLVDTSRPLAESIVVALVWSWYNMIILALACFVCIEQPQRSERIVTDEIVDVEGQAYRAVDISASGVRLLGQPPGEVGSWWNLRVGNRPIRAWIARNTEDGFAVAFEATVQNRAFMIGHIFSHRYGDAIRNIESGKLIGGITRRLMS